MVHKSLMTEMTIKIDGELWIEKPILSIQTTSTDSEIFIGLENYAGMKGWPEETYSGK